LRGIHMELAWPYSRSLGIAADFPFYIGAVDISPVASLSDIRVRQTSLSIGPQVTLQKGRFKTSFRLMFGFADGSAEQFELNSTTVTANISESSFILLFGSNFDVPINEGITLRLAQPNYQMSRFGSKIEHSFRFSSGLIFHR